MHSAHVHLGLITLFHKLVSCLCCIVSDVLCYTYQLPVLGLVYQLCIVLHVPAACRYVLFVM